MNARFIQLLRNATFNQRIAFIAIDELHTVYQWKDFRSSYPNLHFLRSIIPQSIPLFGCTATLTEEAETFVLYHAGFRPENVHILRTSIDRPDVSIIVQCLKKGAIYNDYRRLSFLIEGAKVHAITSIPKTIVYIDSRSGIIKARHFLLQELANLGFDERTAARVILKYHALTPELDQRKIYDEFRLPGSIPRKHIRIGGKG